jgi:plastocyanin
MLRRDGNEEGSIMLRISVARGLLAMGAVALLIGAAACGDDDDGGGTRQVGSLSFNDHGTTDVSGKTEIAFEADSFYFEPTFLKGTAGQKVVLEIENESDTLHNISASSLGVDTDIPAKGKVQVELTFPASGALLFVCKYHAGQGMRGELLTGDAQPQDLAQAAGVTPGATPGATSSSGYGY